MLDGILESIGSFEISSLLEVENLVLIVALFVAGIIALSKEDPEESEPEDGSEYLPTPIAPAAPPPKKKRFTMEELASYRGYKTEVLMACKGVIFHVDPTHYGPKAGYHVFAGKDVTRHLGKMKVGDEEANRPWGDLTAEETTIMEDWDQKFKKKYDIWGWLEEDFVTPAVDPAELESIHSNANTAGEEELIKSLAEKRKKKQKEKEEQQKKGKGKGKKK